MKRIAPLVLLLVALGTSAGDPGPVAERLSPYGLPQPVLVVAGSLPEDFENEDAITVIDATKDSPPVGFQFLKDASGEPTPGKVGLYVPPGGVFQIKKRAMSNVGKGVVTLRLAKS